MEATWLLKSLFLEDSKSATYVQAVKGVMEEFGLSPQRLVGVLDSSAGRAAKDIALLSPIAIPVQCAARGLNLVVKHVCKALPLATLIVQAVSGCLHAGGALAMRQRRAKAFGLRPWKLHYDSTRWFSMVEVAVEIRDHMRLLVTFVETELRVQGSTSLDDEPEVASASAKLTSAWHLLRNRQAEVQLSIIGMLAVLGPVFTALQGRHRNTPSPMQVTVLQRLRQNWQRISATQASHIKLALAGFPTTTLDTMSKREKKEAKSVLWTAAKQGILAYDKYVAGTLALVQVINLFHPPYLVKIPTLDSHGLCDLLGVADHSPGPSEPSRVISDILATAGALPDVFNEFMAYQTAVRLKCDPLLFGPGYWGIGGPACREWKTLAVVARRFLAMQPSVCAVESSFSYLTQLDTPQRQNLDREHLAWELFVAYNGGNATAWQEQMTAGGGRVNPRCTGKRAISSGVSGRSKQAHV